ncbi:MAG: mechanosensitive ion channel domain-containing protein [Actinomycetota bacterium]
MSAARPHLIRAVIAGVIALAGMTAASFGDICAGRIEPLDCSPEFFGGRGLAIVGAAVLVLAGLLAVRSAASAMRRASEDRLGTARSGSLGFLVSAIGYLVLVLATLSVLDVDLGALLLGGAITGVIVGIAAQQTLGNFFAGIVLLVAQPFAIGDRVVLRSGPLGGEYEGDVSDMGIFYVTLQTERGRVDLPNAGVLSAAIGPGARSADEVEDEGSA